MNPLRTKNNIAWILFLILVFGLLIGLGLIGDYFSHNFSGEEFTVYQYAHNSDHITAWKTYFYEIGRPIAVTYWTYFYEFFDYNPLVARVFSFLLLSAASVAAVLFFLGPDSLAKENHLYKLFPFFILLNWISLPLAMSVSSDQRHLSLLFLFLSGLCVKNWALALKAKWVWLSLALLLFLLSAFTYESTSLLFPALLLRVWPLTNIGEKRKKFAIFGLLGILGLLIGVMPYLTYFWVGKLLNIPLNTPSMATLSSPLETGIRYASNALNFGQGTRLLPPTLAILPTVLSGLIFASAAFTFFRPTHQGTKNGRRELAFVYFSSLWILFIGILPYAIAGYNISIRVYSSAIFGLFGLAIFAFRATTNRGIKYVVSTAIALSMFLGLAEATYFKSILIEREEKETRFYLNLKEVVPNVKPGTTFIFIDHPQSTTGCGASLSMLYNKPGITCAHLSSTDANCFAIKYSNYMSANCGGNLRTQNWIILIADESKNLALISDLAPGDFNLVIEWVDTSPIYTDYRRIEPEDNENSAFLEYLKSHE